MGFLDLIKSRNKELEYLMDFDLIEDTSKKIHMKKLAIQICVDMIARTISQSDFRVKNGKEIIKDELYYRLNVRPNQNQTASTFWQQLVHKLIKENQVLVVKTDTDDLLIADSFTRTEYAVFEDSFSDVTVKNYTFNRTYKMSEVIYLQYTNEKLTTLLDGLYTDYGELFGRIVEFQKRKNQIRGLVDIEAIHDKSEESQAKLQNYINKIYKAFAEKSIAIVPQQKGFKLEESKQPQQTHPVDEVNKVTDGFLYQVANSLGIPIAMLKGEMADVEKQTRNYMNFCIDPFLKKIRDEGNAKFIDKADFLKGKRMEIKRISYNNIFDVATAVDKLRAAGIFNGNELREELGADRVDNPLMDEYFITKNYQTVEEALKGGEKP
ncbi:phage portal protein, HK97 family [Neobacillus massiliamazoniensis]|uniref:Phage portal protein, HK97 family n=1 Tax=Neobacillus massiliamazoniensis TaxID=1499688 RepID=A0A0U1NQI6_9BACI|nr:phage portal protein, HK97 family [Neobacillus massiliamazoniensis]